jgi:hypothetical protein
MPQPIEFFVASDASAVIDQTKRVLYLEDDDIAHISEGGELTVAVMTRRPAYQPSLIFRIAHPPIAKGRWSFLCPSHRDLGDRACCHHEGTVRSLHAEGNLRAAGIRRQHHARSSQLRHPISHSRWSQGILAGHSKMPKAIIRRVRYKLPLMYCCKFALIHKRRSPLTIPCWAPSGSTRL